MEIIAKRIHDLRIDNDLLQKQIASILKISQQYYSEYENGKREIPIRHIKTICCYYNISAEYILGFTNKPKMLPKD